jgi:hypothetical protein
MASDIRTISPISQSERDDLVRTLQGWLEHAKNGELLGVVMLGQRRGSEIQHMWAGRIDAASAAWAFECWKRDALTLVQRGDEEP